MRFITESGTSYELTDIEEAPGGYTATLSRDGVPIVHYVTGEPMAAPLPAETVFFSTLPEVGKRFSFISPTAAGCMSTPVREIEDED